MAYYHDPAYQQEARLAVIELGCYFTSRWWLRVALDLPLGSPGRWFDGSLPAPATLARIQTFLHLAVQVDEISKDRVQTGRFFAGANFGRQMLDDPTKEAEILAKAEAYFAAGPPMAPGAQWQAPLTAKHPKLFEAVSVTPADSALAGLLGPLTGA